MHRILSAPRPGGGVGISLKQPLSKRLLDPGMSSLRGDWELDPIRGEAQFKAIQAQMKFPP
jgi:hypothetical protein